MRAVTPPHRSVSGFWLATAMVAAPFLHRVDHPPVSALPAPEPETSVVASPITAGAIVQTGMLGAQCPGELQAAPSRTDLPSTAVQPGSAAADGADGHDGAAPPNAPIAAELGRIRAPFDTETFSLPPFPEIPKFAGVRQQRAFSVSRAELTYRKRDGSEWGGWAADLYLPAGAAEDHRALAEQGRLAAGRSALAVHENDPSARMGTGGVPGKKDGVDDGVPGKEDGVDTGVSGAGLRPVRARTSDLSKIARIGDASGSSHAMVAVRKRPLIVLLPFGGLRLDLSKSFARHFAREGFAVLDVKRPPPEAEGAVFHSIRGTAKTFAEDTMNLRRAIGWASHLPEVDPERIGVFGVSRGAIVAALAVQQDPKLTAVLVLGGADLAGLFRDSRLGAVKRLRARETERAGGNFQRAAASATELLRPVDPASRPGRIDPLRTLLIGARWDRVIPKAQSLAFREAAGGATQVWLPAGHDTTLLFARKVRALASKHFSRFLRPRE